MSQSIEAAVIELANSAALDVHDRPFVVTLAERARAGMTLTPRQRRAGATVLKRYEIAFDERDAPAAHDLPPVTKGAVKSSVQLFRAQDGERIGMRTPYRLKDVVKAMPGRSWHPDGKFWSVPATPQAASQAMATFRGCDADDFVASLAKVYDEQQRRRGELEEIPVDQLAPIPITESDPWDHQLRAYHFAVDKVAAMLAMDMGCVTGDAIVVVNRAGASRRMTVAELHHKFHGGASPFGKKGSPALKLWRTDVVTRVRGMKADGSIGLVTLVASLDKGIQPIVEVILESGRILRCTPDHELLTPDRRKVHAETLVPGAAILVDDVGGRSWSGERGEALDPEVRPERPPGTDSRGYVWIYDPDHPCSNVNGQYLEHVAVMTEMLGRPLVSPEMVHHLNEVPWDNDPANLVLCADQASHSRYHDWRRNLPGSMPVLDRVISVKPAGEEHVYDLSVDDDAHTWIANGVVVGNTGKSKVTIDILVNNGAKTVLIQCPKSVLKVWPREFRKHAPGKFHVEMLTDGKRSIVQRKERAEWLLNECPCGRPHVLLINYEAAWQKGFAPWALSVTWDYVIHDESQRIKSPNGTMSKFAAKLRDRAHRRLALSGTPMEQHPFDIWAQYRALDPAIFGASNTSFNHRYGIYGGWQGKQIVGLNPETQQELADLYFSIAFEVGAEVLKLEKPRDTTRSCEMTQEQARAYYEIENEMYAEWGDSEVTTQNVLVKMLRLMQITGGALPLDDGTVAHISDAKEKLLEEVINEAAGKPCVVFCQYVHDLDVVERVTAKMNLRYGELAGRRNDLTEDAMMPEDVDVMGVQLQAGGVGIDLTRAQVGIYYSVGRSLGNYKQSRARLVRPGQLTSVLFVHLVCEGTIDEITYEALANNQNVIDAVRERKRVAEESS